MSTSTPDTTLSTAAVRRSRWWMTLPLMAATAALAGVAWQQPPAGDASADHMIRFAGRLHPVLAHLPIGMLVLVPVLDVLGVFRRSRHLWGAGQLVLWLGTLGAIVVAASGYVLARFGGESGEDVIDHQWAGIATAGAACVALMLRSLARGGVRRKTWGFLYLLVMGFAMVCLAAAGHLGGKLTHGDDYLTRFAPEPIRELLGGDDHEEHEITPPTTLPSVEPLPAVPVSTLPLEQRPVFASIIQPIFIQRCVECHGAKKSKNDLRLDSYDRAMQGGESGSTIVAGSAADSELVRLIKLPASDRDIMPPTKKATLDPAEITAIEWWVSSGASQTMTIGEAKDLPDVVRALSR